MGRIHSCDAHAFTRQPTARKPISSPEMIGFEAVSNRWIDGFACVSCFACHCMDSGNRHSLKLEVDLNNLFICLVYNCLPTFRYIGCAWLCRSGLYIFFPVWYLDIRQAILALVYCILGAEPTTGTAQLRKAVKWLKQINTSYTSRHIQPHKYALHVHKSTWFATLQFRYVPWPRANL